MRRLPVLLLVLLAGACNSGDGLRAAPTSSADGATTSTSQRGNPQQLVGWWRVTEPEDGGHLGLGENGYVLHPCGASDISWRASPSGLFVAAVFGGDGSCYEKPPRPDVSWLDPARSYEVTDETLILRGSDGSVVVRATREAAPPGRDEMHLTPALLEAMATPADLPEGVTAVTATDLVGRWGARGGINPRAYASFAADGMRRCSDGCNGDGGRYVLGEGGEFLTTFGVTTLVACNNAPLPVWVGDAHRLGLEDGALLLYDAKGKLLGRLWQTPAASPTATGAR
jgi:hypothetical protein